MNAFIRHSFLLRAVVILLSSIGMQAQAQSGTDRVAVDLTDPARPAFVRANLINGGITVRATDGRQVIVEARARHHDSGPSEGSMKRFPGNATGLSVEEENNQIDVRTEALNRTIDLTITVPRHTSLRLNSTNNGDIVVSDVDGELDVNDINGSVTLTNIGGSAVAHSLNGRVLATFNRIDPQKPMSFSSMNGDVDVTFPAGLTANVSFQSDHGEVHSDFEVQLQQNASGQVTEDRKENGGRYLLKTEKTIRGTINGGGPEIQFKTFNGSIYVRKGK